MSPAYQFEDKVGADLHFKRRPQFATFDAVLASKRFAGYPERLNLKGAQLSDPAFLFEQFCAATMVFLPQSFDRESRPLSAQ